MFSEKYHVIIEGVAPLLHNRFTNEAKFVRHDPEEESKAALYTDDDGNPVHPANHIETAMIRQATNYRVPGKGKKTYKDFFKSGIMVEPLQIPLNGAKWVVDMTPVVVNRARIMRARPRFDKWTLEFFITNNMEMIREENIKDILSDAGQFSGIGDDHPRHGRFIIKTFEKVT